MNIFLKFAASALVILGLFNCCSPKISYKDKFVTERNGLKITAKWTKVKSKKIDVMLGFENKTKRTFYIKRSSVLLTVANKPGKALIVAGRYPKMKEHPEPHQVGWKIIPEDIEILAGEKIEELFIYKFETQVGKPKSGTVKINGIYSGSTNKKGRKQRAVTFTLPLTE